MCGAPALFIFFYGHHFLITMDSIPYDIYELGYHSLAYHALARFKQLLQRDMMMPPDIAEQIEDNIIPALEYIDGWEPTDAQIQAHIDSRGMI